MNSKKTIFIIPGFKQKPQNKAYKNIAVMLKKKGYFPVSVKIPWNNTTISENTELFLNQYKKIKRKKKYILGFSYGAMVAFLAASKVKTAGLILCSLSPYFKEDLPKTVKPKTKIEKKRFSDFKHLKSSALAKSIKAKKVLMLYGESETKPLIRRVTKTYKHIPIRRKFLIPVHKAQHDIGDRKYLQTLHDATSALL